MNIFYCDDDPDDIDFFKEVIKRIDPKITLTACSDALTGLDTLTTLDPIPDFIFFDSCMPPSDGIECVISVKRNQKLKKIPVVMISDNLDRKQIRDYNMLGVYMFISKTNLEDLEQSLRSILLLNSTEVNKK